MTFATWVFRIAGIYGILILVPMYFAEKQIGVNRLVPSLLSNINRGERLVRFGNITARDRFGTMVVLFPLNTAEQGEEAVPVC